MKRVITSIVFATKKEKYWVFANFFGIVVFLCIAFETWDSNHALPGLFPEFAIEALVLLLFALLNLSWLIKILLYRVWSGLLVFLAVGLLWTAAYKINQHYLLCWSKLVEEA